MGELAGTNLTYLFPTPFARHVWSDGAALNEQLRPLILARERSTRGAIGSNVDGWQSEADTLPWCGKAGEQLIRHIMELVNHVTYWVLADVNRQAPAFSWSLQAWANVNRTGAFNRQHIHSGATWSGIYYVDTGDPPADAQHGTLVLTTSDPGRASTFMPELASTEIAMKPEPGLTVRFPAYLPHAVSPHKGKRPRISIAFNLRKEPFP